MKTSLRRIPSLGGLRTISIALVIIGHSSQVLGFSQFAHLGTLGVRVFFVISGFLITGLLLKEIEKNIKINLLKFYLRRTLRIFPPFYFRLHQNAFYKKFLASKTVFIFPLFILFLIFKAITRTFTLSAFLQ